MTEISKDCVLGLDSNHIFFEVDKNIARPIHKEIVTPFLKLQADAKIAGFDLQMVSGFRDFDRQLRIWDAKASGQRTLLNDAGEELDFEMLSAEQLLSSILRWSALPGASRHHWGTDIDVFDASAVPSDYDVQLTPEEVEGNGPFVALHEWLDERMEKNLAHGFFRPYAKDTGGIAPERWHLSYAPLAYKFQQALDQKQLLSTWKKIDLPLLSQVEKRWDEIWEKFIWVDYFIYPSVIHLN